MVKDRRYRHAKEAVQKGDFTRLRDIIKYVPKTILAKDLHIDPGRIDRLLLQVQFFKFIHMILLSELMDISMRKMTDLFFRQYKADQWEAGNYCEF